MAEGPIVNFVQAWRLGMFQRPEVRGKVVKELWRVADHPELLDPVLLWPHRSLEERVAGISDDPARLHALHRTIDGHPPNYQVPAIFWLTSKPEEGVGEVLDRQSLRKAIGQKITLAWPGDEWFDSGRVSGVLAAPAEGHTLLNGAGLFFTQVAEAVNWPSYRGDEALFLSTSRLRVQEVGPQRNVGVSTTVPWFLLGV